MTEYRTRLIDQVLTRRMAGLPAVMLMGPRACGKTTTALRHARTAVRMDRAGEAAVFKADPDAALRGLAEPVLLDEWQMAPETLGAVKRAVDEDSRPGRFILAGSLHAMLALPGGWPGVGRVVNLEMWPLTAAEQKSTNTKPLLQRMLDGDDLEPAAGGADLRDYIGLAVRGGFPQAALTVPQSERRPWLEGYIDGIIARDVLGGRNPALFRRFFNAYAASSAGMVTDRKLCDAAGINHRTAETYRDHLQNLMIVDEIPAWSSRRLKRTARSPKRFVTDSGLLAAAWGSDREGVLRNGDLLGRMLETFAVQQIRGEVCATEGKPALYHFRSGDGREIDLVIEMDARRIIALEIKAKTAPDGADARHLAWLRDRMGDEFIGGAVLHTGPGSYKIEDRIRAVPISALWS